MWLKKSNELYFETEIVVYRSIKTREERSKKKTNVWILVPNMPTIFDSWAADVVNSIDRDFLIVW